MHSRDIAPVQKTTRLQISRHTHTHTPQYILSDYYLWLGQRCFLLVLHLSQPQKQRPATPFESSFSERNHKYES